MKSLVASIYYLFANIMKLIVGLGNPGEKYKNTRHNIGFMTLEAILSKFEPAKKTFWEEKKDLKSNIKFLSANSQEPTAKSPPSPAGRQIILAKPTTFMNNSGFAIARLLSFYKVESNDLIVIHDDSDLPLGKIRVRFGGASGGHRGVQSIIDVLGSDKFLRVRLGIGRPKKISNFKLQISNLDKYVLAAFSAKDKSEIKHMIKQAIRAIELILKNGLEVYMSKYNK